MPENEEDPTSETPKPAPAAQPPPQQGVVLNTSKVFGFGKDLLTLCVIPLFLWGVKLEVGNAQRDLLIAQQEKEIARLEARIKEAEDIDKGVQANNLKLAVLEGKLDTANGRLGEITALLREW